MRRPHHIEATCTIAVASHHRALELAGRSLGTRRPDATAPLHLSPSSASLHAAERAQTSPAPLHSTTPSLAPQNPLQRLLFAKPAGEPKKTPQKLLRLPHCRAPPPFKIRASHPAPLKLLMPSTPPPLHGLI